MRTYIHTYVQTYRHTYIHTYIQTYMHTHRHTCIHAYKHTDIHTCIHTYMAQGQECSRWPPQKSTKCAYPFALQLPAQPHREGSRTSSTTGHFARDRGPLALRHLFLVDYQAGASTSGTSTRGLRSCTVPRPVRNLIPNYVSHCRACAVLRQWPLRQLDNQAPAAGSADNGGKACKATQRKERDKDDRPISSQASPIRPQSRHRRV